MSQGASVLFPVVFILSGNMISRKEPIDTMLMVLRKDDSSLVTFTELRDAKGVHILGNIFHSQHVLAKINEKKDQHYVQY